MQQRELLERASAWVRENGCPLPVDLATEMRDAGLDVEFWEGRLMEEVA